MKNFIHTLFKKTQTTCFSFPMILFLSNRDEDGKIIEPKIFEKWLIHLLDCIPSTIECITDTVKQYAMTSHNQIVEETVEVVTLHNMEFPLTIEDLEHIITSLIKFGQNTHQSNICYELNGTTYNLQL